jgi:phage-related protein
MVEQQKIPLVFYRLPSGREPVREFLKSLPIPDRKSAGDAILAAQWKFPVGMPLCRAMGNGLYEIRTSLPSGRIARTFIMYHRGRLVALHAFIKKTQKTPETELKLAQKRKQEIEHEKE